LLRELAAETGLVQGWTAALIETCSTVSGDCHLAARRPPMDATAVSCRHQLTGRITNTTTDFVVPPDNPSI
jgi:hypothetical protein